MRTERSPRPRRPRAWGSLPAGGSASHLAERAPAPAKCAWQRHTRGVARGDLLSHTLNTLGRRGHCMRTERSPRPRRPRASGSIPAGGSASHLAERVPAPAKCAWQRHTRGVARGDLLSHTLNTLGRGGHCMRTERSPRPRRSRASGSIPAGGSASHLAERVPAPAKCAWQRHTRGVARGDLLSHTLNTLGRRGHCMRTERSPRPRRPRASGSIPAVTYSPTQLPVQYHRR